KIKIGELLDHNIEIAEIADIFSKNKKYIDFLVADQKNFNNLIVIREAAKNALWLNDIIAKVKYFAKDNINFLSYFKESHIDDTVELRQYIDSAKKLKNRLFGYLGKKKEIEQLNQGFRKTFTFSKLENPHKHLEELEAVINIYKYIIELREDQSHPHYADFVYLVTSILKNRDIYFTDDQLNHIRSSLEALVKIEIATKELSSSNFSIATLQDLNNVAVVSEIGLLYEELSGLFATEKELIEPNIDLKKGGDIAILFCKDNLNEMIKEVITCKKYVDAIIEINDDVAYLKESSCNYKDSLTKAGINNGSFASLYDNKLTEISDLEFEKLLRLVVIHQELTDKFENIKDLSYEGQTRQIENIVTMQMTYLMDERFVDFTDSYKNDAKALKQIIKEKKKFPKEQFSKLKNAFPCILAGIRDYAEYIPLEPEIFDLVIIDEASQVSIAQAFPALLRAKKVVVLGDNLQFSNVKSALARGDINKQYLASLKEVFLRNVSTEADKIVRLEKFNIKVSILDFLDFINNYKTRLVKHFRGYRELISYSNKFFYKGSLQVMKVRGTPINSVLRFSYIEHDGLDEIIKNTNIPEIDFIVSELKILKEQGKKCTVGIITPHTNQQSLLYEKISGLPESDYFFDILKLKIMTFDTCQGEEMDIIFYSMVATKTNDKLNYVFISDLNNIDLDDDEGKIKAQRLNVGLSRAKECMHFVLSKPIDQYTGTVKEFLQHYSNMLIEGQKELDSSTVDKKSQMEPLVLGWFYQTKFWEENKETAEILPQFELGKYLKQLDKSYNHPNYRVDFLLVYNDNDGDQHKIIIEYDGFLEHFGDSMHIVNASNYEEYYSPEDVYRQHVLEGYGYKFIRINKFNLGENPIENLDFRIQEIVKKNFTVMR
ncbi:AAA domain-containing protein, partial [bacterium]|nr:AAA domain-containing protein [bacterium]